MAPKEVKGHNPGQTAFITPATFWPEETSWSTRFWVGSSGSEARAPRGSILEGSSMVAAPGKASLSVTGPTGGRNGAV